MVFEERRDVAAVGPVIIGEQGFSGDRGIQAELLGKVGEKEFHQPDKSDAVGAADAGIEPFGEAEEGVEGGGVSIGDAVGVNKIRDAVESVPTMIEEGAGVDEVAAVADEVPKAGETAQLLHGGEIDEFVLQDLVGRM